MLLFMLLNYNEWFGIRNTLLLEFDLGRSRQEWKEDHTTQIEIN